MLYFVKDRAGEMLAELIERHVESDTNVHTDGWAGYKKIDWESNGLVRYEHIHQNARTFEHCNHIEGFWV